jgi:predicted nucleotidyltransferase
MPLPAITPFQALDRVLRGLTDEVHAALGDDFAGLYLLGSFALGDGDEFSDVDFSS